jgi:hypothetical protein
LQKFECEKSTKRVAGGSSLPCTTSSFHAFVSILSGRAAFHSKRLYLLLYSSRYFQFKILKFSISANFIDFDNNSLLTFLHEGYRDANYQPKGSFVSSRYDPGMTLNRGVKMLVFMPAALGV